MLIVAHPWSILCSFCFPVRSPLHPSEECSKKSVLLVLCGNVSGTCLLSADGFNPLRAGRCGLVMVITGCLVSGCWHFSGSRAKSFIKWDTWCCVSTVRKQNLRSQLIPLTIESKFFTTTVWCNSFERPVGPLWYVWFFWLYFYTKGWQILNILWPLLDQLFSLAANFTSIRGFSDFHKH